MVSIKRTNRANSTAEQDVCNKCSETIGGSGCMTSVVDYH